MSIRRQTSNILRQAVCGLFVVLMLSIATAEAFASVDCENGAEVKDAAFCNFFFKRLDPSIAVVEETLSSRIPSAQNDPPIRSFALLVGVYDYPNFRDSKYKHLAPAEDDLRNLKAFFEKQKFDEIIVLENASATKDNIEYFLRDYLQRQVRLYNKRSRVVFAFAGHGGPGNGPNQPGTLVLSQAEDGSSIDHTYKLENLAPLLKDLGRQSFHFVALLGSCFSGGIFPRTDSSGDNIFYAKAPGAHAVSSAKLDELAVAINGQHGSNFFNALIQGVESGNADPLYSNIVQDQTGVRQSRGGGIVRLGALQGYMSAYIEQLGKNPDTGLDFPQPWLGRLVDSGDSGGAFFFLGPAAKSTVVVSKGDRLQPELHQTITLGVGSTQATTNSIIEYPEVKLFNAPDTYVVQGIDASHYDAEIDWPKLHIGALQFAYLKATQSDGFIDQRFKQNWARAREAGFVIGAYHVFSFCKSAQKQFELIKSVVPVDSTALPIAIDIQWNGGPLLQGEQSCNNADAIKRQLFELTKSLQTFYGKIPVLHGFTSTFDDLVDDRFLGNSVWLQDFRKVKGVGPALFGKNAWSFWQYTSNAILPGSSSKLDVNAFFGSEADFKQFVRSGENLALRKTAPTRRENPLSCKGNVC